MADNIAVTPGSGKTVLADEVVDGTLGTGVAQFVKLMDGTLDGTNKLVITSSGAATVDGSGVTQGTYAAMQWVDVALSTDTAAYASGDVIADSQVVAACVRANDAFGVLQSLTLIDEDDQGVALTVLFLDANVSVGTENAAPSITDVNARNVLGWVSVATSDYVDLGGVRVAFKSNLGMVVKPATGTDDIYVAVVNGSGAPTYSASGLRLRLAFIS